MHSSLEQPFFICGTGRCGSTMLCRILQAHDNVGLTNESRIIDVLHFFSRYAGLPRPQAERFALDYEIELHGIIGDEVRVPFATLVTEHARQILLEFYEQQFLERRVTHWGDKLPNGDAALAVREFFPNTKYVVLIRDPRDTFASVVHFARRPGVQKISPFLGDLTINTFCPYWRSTYDGAMTLASEPHFVRYEDLVADPLAVTRSVLEYLGLELQPAQITEIETAPSFRQHGTSSDVESSIGRWRRDLTSEEVARIESECGALMVAHGYGLSGMD